MEFNYKIPVSHILLMTGVLFYITMGAHGHAGDSFNQTEFIKFTANLSFAMWIIFCFLWPRNKKIVLNDQGILVPNVLLLPYKDRGLRWRDVVDYDIRVNRNYTATIILKTKYGNYKIHSWLCLNNFELAIFPKSYNSIQDTIIEQMILAKRQEP